MPPELAAAVPVTVKLPVVFVSEMPLAAPFADTLVSETMPLKLDSRTAVPVVDVTFTSLTPTPAIAATGSVSPVLVPELIDRPRTTTWSFKVTVLLMVVAGAAAGFIVGSAALPVGGVKLRIVGSGAFASCPISVCRSNKVTAPV